MDVSNTDDFHPFLQFWFGDLGYADLPASDRTRFWFGDGDALQQEMFTRFKELYQKAIQGTLDAWAEVPRGRLALIILFDQYSRLAHRASKDAFSHDARAQALSKEGMEKNMDKELTLIERVFFYMPFVHAEDAQKQEQSIQYFQELVTLSLAETTPVYQLFLAYAYAHFKVIHEFGRFPQRNTLLGRESSTQEVAFLKSL